MVCMPDPRYSSIVITAEFTRETLLRFFYYGLRLVSTTTHDIRTGG
jgi:hypothetical protein